jgi:hypothetical protein
MESVELMYSSWKCVGTQSPNRIFSRPLGMTECGFYWDSQLNGTADTLRMINVEICDPAVHINLGTVGQAWIQMKQRFPLLAASAKEDSEDQGGWVRFEVQENRILQNYEKDIVFLPPASSKDADQISDDLLHHKTPEERQLSNDYLSRLYVIQDSDNKQCFHIVFLVSHIITDGIAHASILRNFLNFLTTPSKSAVAYDAKNFEERLRVCVASEDLVPSFGLPVARQRWRRAIALTIVNARRKSFIGGHTLPRQWTASTLTTPGKSYTASITFDAATSTKFIANCRANGQTFGAVYPVIGQVALTRFLARQYTAGKIPQEDWDFRLRERMYTAGPINLRPYLDETWLENGGKENVCLSIAFGFYALPRMPVSPDLRPEDPAPGYGQLLTQSQFFNRCDMVKKQVKEYMKHPLFVEMSATSMPGRVPRTKGVVNRWKRGEINVTKEKQMSVQEQAEQGLILGHGGSSLGNVSSHECKFTGEKPLNVI